jgi:hypothetical protein
MPLAALPNAPPAPSVDSTALHSDSSGEAELELRRLEAWDDPNDYMPARCP